MLDDQLFELRQLFTWRDADHHDAQCAALERGQLAAVAASLNAKLDAEVLAELERQPDDIYMALLGAPDTFFAALYGPTEELSCAIAQWIAVERAAVGEPLALDGRVRAASCERHVAVAGGRVLSIDESPRIAGSTIALDFASELPQRMATRFPSRVLVEPTPEQRALATAKLAAAVAILAEMSPLASDFVHRMTDLICCRTVNNDGKFYTGSDETTLGVVHLYNLHLSRKLAEDVAYELVHEAIHQAVYRHELAAAPLFADPEMRLLKVTSPWTGARLQLYTYVHACFVWYGLATLLRLPTAPALPALVRQRETAEAGFARDPLRHLGEVAAQLCEPVAVVIEDMTREICGSEVRATG